MRFWEPFRPFSSQSVISFYCNSTAHVGATSARAKGQLHESQQINMAMLTNSLTSLVLCSLTVNAWYCNQFDTEKTCDAAVQCTWSHFGCVEASPYHTSTQAFPLVQSFVDCAAAWSKTYIKVLGCNTIATPLPSAGVQMQALRMLLV